ncbi:MAG: hypothetical protein KIS73_11090 [Enhydrobacter sp.]|nr:hypothetical protein [Enhydrobacter sp.]
MASWKTIAAAAAMIAGIAAGAHADKAAGDACAASLNADGKAVYAAVVAANPTTETLRSVIEREARSLAMGGKISRGSARENATAAGECARVGLQ